MSEIKAVPDSPFAHNFERTENHIVSSKSIEQVSEANGVENILKLSSSLGETVSPFVQNFERTENHIVSSKSIQQISEVHSVENKAKIYSRFRNQLASTQDQTNILRNTSASFFFRESDIKCKEVSTSEDISLQTISPVLNLMTTENPTISNKLNQQIVKANSVENTLKTSSSSGQTVLPFVQNFKRTENHIVSSKSIQQISEANSVENTLEPSNSSGETVAPIVQIVEKIENHIVSSRSIQQISEANSVKNILEPSNSSGETVSPIAQNFEKIESHIVSQESIEKASKTNDPEKTVKISCSSMSKFKAPSLFCETSASLKSILLDDAVVDLLRQNRRSWWSEDETPPNLEYQTLSNLTVERQTELNQTSSNGKSFHKSDQRDIYESDNESKDSSSNDRYRRKYRVAAPEKWQSKTTSRDKSSRLDSKEWIFEKPRGEKRFSWKSKFSDESELDDSESSLDGSYRHHNSDYCDSSEDSLSYKYCRRLTTNSSITIEDFPGEFQTGREETLSDQFWQSDLLKYPDNFFEDIGFIAVLLLAVQCLCQYCEYL